MKLDHFYIILNSNAFEQFKTTSAYINLFEHKTTVRPDMTYEGLYLYFEDNTYFEIVDEKCGIPDRSLGVAFNDLDNNDGLVNKLKSENQNITDLEIETIFKEQKEWFIAINRKFSSDVYMWGMEYLGKFFNQRLKYFEKATCKLIAANINSTLNDKELSDRFALLGEDKSERRFNVLELTESMQNTIELEIMDGEKVVKLKF